MINIYNILLWLCNLYINFTKRCYFLFNGLHNEENDGWIYHQKFQEKQELSGLDLYKDDNLTELEKEYSDYFHKDVQSLYHAANQKQINII